MRIPKALLVKYNLDGDVILEEHPNGVLIHAKDNEKLSWEATYRMMVQAEDDDWPDWETLDDGIEEQALGLYT